jgi:hypothetical protein
MRPANRIFHVDGDSFLASYEIALNPKLEDQPVWVGGDRRGDGIGFSGNHRQVLPAGTLHQTWRSGSHGSRGQRLAAGHCSSGVAEGFGQALVPLLAWFSTIRRPASPFFFRRSSQLSKESLRICRDDVRVEHAVD